MSQFIFGELITQSGTIFSQADLNFEDCYPFSVRFILKPNDHYLPVTPEGWLAIPFVVTDSCFDNTAELLLRSNVQWDSNDNLPLMYTKLLNMPMEERIDSLVSALKEIMHKTGCDCILVFCDGENYQEGYQKCSIDVLAAKIEELVCGNQLFNIATFWTTL